MDIQFFTWEFLATAAGSLAGTMAITQALKGVKFLEKVPNVIVSYVAALVIMFAAAYFTGGLSVSSGALIPFNALIIMLAANGSYDHIADFFAKKE